MRTEFCELCGNIFETTLTEKEEEQQMKREFPLFKEGNYSIICQDCFDKHFIVNEQTGEVIIISREDLTKKIND